MSIALAPFIAKVGAAQSVFQSAKSLFGGGGEENVAKTLSARYGCRILQSSAASARLLANAGINPCTKQPIPGGRQTVQMPRDFGTVQPAPMPTIGRSTMSLQGGFQNAAFPAVVGPAVGAVGRFVGGVLAGNVFRTATGRISGVMLGGRRISRKDIAALLRRVGDIATGAAIVGISVQDAADIVISSSKRRRRGITAAQVRNARRTACMVSRLARDLGVKPAPVRRRTCR